MLLQTILIKVKDKDGNESDYFFTGKAFNVTKNPDGTDSDLEISDLQVSKPFEVSDDKIELNNLNDVLGSSNVSTH
jgi:hypothetical protein